MSPETLGRLQWGNTPNTEDSNDPDTQSHLSHLTHLCFRSQPLSCPAANFFLLLDQGFPKASSPGRFLHLEISVSIPFFFFFF